MPPYRPKALSLLFINPVVDVYVKYSPCNILDTEYGPRFHAVSFGVML